MKASATRRAFPLPACGERVARTAGPSRMRGRPSALGFCNEAPHPTRSLRSRVDLSPCTGRGEGGSDELLTMGLVPKDGKDPKTGESVTTWEVAP
jgi:hypothetical protein